MYLRMLQVTVKQEDISGLVRLYEQRIIPALEKFGGCLFACLVQSVRKPEEGISVTLWHSEEDASRYEQSGLFKQLLTEAKPYFAETTEWKLELTKDFTLEYTPSSAEPTLKTYSVSTTGGSTAASSAEMHQPFLRIVSIHLKPGKLEEYRELYRRDIIPALMATSGCRFSCLSTSTADSNDTISVTLWNSRTDAEEYEQKGAFSQLLEGIRHTMSDLSQLRMQSEGTRLPSVTSEDVEVDGFHLLASRSLLA